MSKATTTSQAQHAQYSTTASIPNPYDFANAVSFQSSFPPATPTTSTQPTDTSGSRKRKRSIQSAVETPNKVQRPAPAPTTPANRDSAADMGNPVTSEEKKRNKLGYHRTSVACGHCRRRKIRCLIPEDEPSGRCNNCIKLKKDCHFFPVEQSMPASERRPDSSRKSLLPPRKSSGYSPLVKPHPSQVRDVFQFATPLQMGSRSSFSLPPENTTAAGVFTSPKDVANAAAYNQNFESSSDWGHFSLQNSPEFNVPNQSYSQPQAITHSHWNPPYQAVMPRSNSDFYPQHPSDHELPLQGPHRASFQSNPEVGWTGPVGRSISFSAQGQGSTVPATAEEIVASQRRASTLPASYPYIDPAVEEAVSPTSKPYSTTTGGNPLGITAYDPSSAPLSDLTRSLVQPTMGWGIVGNSAQPRTYSNPQSGNPSTSVEQSPFPSSAALSSAVGGFRPGDVNVPGEFPFTAADNGSIPALSYGENWPGTY